MTNMLPSLPNASEDMYWVLPCLVDDEGEIETIRNRLFLKTESEASKQEQGQSLETLDWVDF